MIKSLYEITDDFKKLEFMLEEGEFDEEAIQEAIADVLKDLDVKAEGYMKFIKNLESQENAIKSEIDRLNTRKSEMAKKKESMLKGLQNAMEITSNDSVGGDLFTAKLRKRPKSVIILNQDLVPKIYINTPIPEPKVDKKAVADAIKRGEVVDGVEYKSLGNTLKIS